jgi:tetratricopeptide (TPR) repeat protein
MASNDVSAAGASAAPPRPARRRWPWLILAAVVLTAGGFLAVQGWAAWRERLAGAALFSGRLDQAQRYIDQALKVRSGWTSTHLLAARIARRRGAYSEAEQHLSRCGPLHGMSEAVQLEWLLLRCQRGEVDELAPGLLGQVDEDHPESAAILEALASVYMRDNRYLEALRCLDRWIECEPNSVTALDWRGWVGNQLDHRGQATLDFDRALQLQPDRSDIRFRLADMLVDSSRPDEALPHLERLRKEQPDNPDVQVDLARCWGDTGRVAEARALFDSVLAEHPDHSDALLHRGKLELNNRQPVEAERWLRKATRLKPWDPQARFALYRSLQAQPDRQQEAEKERVRWQSAVKIGDRLRRLMRTELAGNPNDPDLAREAGELFLHIREDQRGLFWLRRALALRPGDRATLKALIAYYERTNNPDRASEYRRQLSRD